MAFQHLPSLLFQLCILKEKHSRNGENKNSNNTNPSSKFLFSLPFLKGFPFFPNRHTQLVMQQLHLSFVANGEKAVLALGKLVEDGFTKSSFYFLSIHTSTTTILANKVLLYITYLSGRQTFHGVLIIHLHGIILPNCKVGERNLFACLFVERTGTDQREQQCVNVTTFVTFRQSYNMIGHLVFITFLNAIPSWY